MRLRNKILGSILLLLIVAIAGFAYAISRTEPCPALPEPAAGANGDWLVDMKQSAYSIVFD